MQTFEHLALVALDPTGRPLITSPVLVGVDAVPGYDAKVDKPHASAHLDVTYSPTGFTLTGPVLAPTTLPKSTWQDLVDELRPVTQPVAF